MSHDKTFTFGGRSGCSSHRPSDFSSGNSSFGALTNLATEPEVEMGSEDVANKYILYLLYQGEYIQLLGHNRH